MRPVGPAARARQRHVAGAGVVLDDAIEAALDVAARVEAHVLDRAVARLVRVRAGARARARVRAKVNPRIRVRVTVRARSGSGSGSSSG